jgi:hypothetical protein
VKTSNKILILILAIVFLFNLGFTLFIYYLPVIGNEKHTTETRKLANFDKLITGGAYNIRVEQGKENSIKINAESNIIKYISSEIKNGTLKISYSRSISPTKTIEILLTSNNLKSIYLESPSYVFLNNINYDKFKITVTLGDALGTPKFKATGKVNNLELKCTSFAHVDLRDLKCNTANVQLFGNSIAEINANIINAYINGKCELIYFENSKIVNPQVFGGGKVIKNGTSIQKIEKPEHSLWIFYYHIMNKLIHFFSIL